MGFREVLCVSAAAVLGIWGTSFPHDQYSEIHIWSQDLLGTDLDLYIYFSLLFDFSLAPLFLYPSAFSYQCVEQLFLLQCLLSITHAHLCSIT